MGLVTLGWVVSHLTASRREGRKETRAAIDQFRSVCDRLWEESKSYHTAASHCPDRSRSVKSLLNQLSIILPYCHALDVQETMAYSIASVRKDVTLSNFDSPHKFTQLSLDDDRLRRISGGIDTLVIKIEKAFTNKYHEPNWFLALFK